MAVKLKDAKSTDISDDTRFTTAYGAALLLAKMALACAGYRLDSKLGGHHKTAFDALPYCVGVPVQPLTDYFDLCRRKRNEIDYDRANVASRADADEIIEQTNELRKLIESWIQEKYPALA
ncbi:MAG: hypothetical protein KF708_16525 [Pirellulales bacterium]|nr:hypothetical protein [Pirellulales bacterium]